MIRVGDYIKIDRYVVPVVYYYTYDNTPLFRIKLTLDQASSLRIGNETESEGPIFTGYKTWNIRMTDLESGVSSIGLKISKAYIEEVLT